MIKKNMILVIDIDGTLCPIKKNYESYTSIIPFKEIVNKLIELRSLGWYIILHSARGMASKDGNIGKINAEVLPDLLNWLKKNKIPYDEIHVAKPWPGNKGFYVDDRSVRPKEFLNMTFDQLEEICSNDRLK